METTRHTPGRVRRGMVASTAMTLSLLASGRAVAQEAAVAPTTSAPVAAEERGGLEDIVVTARKRVESAQDIPVSVTAISAERIQRLDLTSLEKVAASTPQFNVGRASNGSGAQITLRGIGSQSTSIGLEQSTAIVVDGVYYGQGRIIDEAFFDLARVELLKGPQALFFGKNATAGVVNIATADPTDKLEIMARAGYEFNAQQVIGEGVISGPITGNLTGRLAIRASKMHSSLFDNRAVPTTITTVDLATGIATPRVQAPNDNALPGTNEKVIRATLKWEPTDRLTLTLKGSGNRSMDQGNAYNYVPFRCANADGTTQTNPNVRCRKGFDIRQPNAPAGFGGGIVGSRADGASFNLYKSVAFTGAAAYQLDDVSITSVSNYNWNRNKWGLGFNIESPTSFTASTENTSFWAFSNETRVQTTFDGPLNLLVGSYYQKSKRDYQQQGAFAPITDSSAPAGRTFENYSKTSQSDGETLSGFGQVSWKVLPRVELAAGVRYTHETKDSFLFHPYIISALRGLFSQFDPANPATLLTANQTFNNWSPEATVTYKPTQDITIYGAYKTAYKSGGFSNSAFVLVGAPASNVAFDPEKASGFEGGIKTTSLDNQLRFNVSAYTYKYSNLQVDFFDPITFAFITTNAGAATTKGVEVEMEFAPRAVEGLNLHGSVNFNKARYKNYIAPCYGGQSIAAGCNTSFRGGLGQDLSGKPTAIAPKWTASLGANYEVPVGAFVVGASADTRYSSSYLGSSFGEPLSRQQKYASLDASLRVRTADEHWELALIGRNLTNNFHISGILDAPNSGSGTGTNTALPADILGLADSPRTVRAQLTWRF